MLVAGENLPELVSLLKSLLAEQVLVVWDQAQFMFVFKQFLDELAKLHHVFLDCE